MLISQEKERKSTRVLPSAKQCIAERHHNGIDTYGLSVSKEGGEEPTKPTSFFSNDRSSDKHENLNLPPSERYTFYLIILPSSSFAHRFSGERRIRH